MRRLSLASVFISLLLLTHIGCGGKKHVPVSGIITMDGQPYGNALITFFPAEASELSAVGKSDDNGNFKMGTETPGNGVKPGKYKVTVVPGPDPEATFAGHPSDAFKNKGPAAGKVDATKEFKKLQIETGRAHKKPPPTIYWDPDKTTLNVEITNEPQDKLELKLLSDAK